MKYDLQITYKIKICDRVRSVEQRQTAVAIPINYLYVLSVLAADPACFQSQLTRRTCETCAVRPPAASPPANGKNNVKLIESEDLGSSQCDALCSVSIRMFGL